MRRGRPEAKLEADILLDLGAEADVGLYKNESGQGFYGAVRSMLVDPHRGLLKGTGELRVEAEKVLMRHRLTYGLGVGSPDLVCIGQGPCPHCSGPIRGLFVGLEEKDPKGGRLQESQKDWRDAARGRGAIVEEVRSVADARRILGC